MASSLFTKGPAWPQDSLPHGKVLIPLANCGQMVYQGIPVEYHFFQDILVC
jgi:hypothetical protein